MHDHSKHEMIKATAMGTPSNILKSFVAILIGLGLSAGNAWAQSAQNVIPFPTAKPGVNDAIQSGPLLEPTEPEVFPNQPATLRLSASMVHGGKLLNQDMVWRVYSEDIGPDGKLPLLGTFAGGSASFRLPSGYYLVHGAFGYAGLTKRVKLLPPITDASFALQAGGLRLNSAFREGDIIPTNDLSFEIARREGDVLKPILSDAQADEIIRLSAGQYHVISRYGEINSEVTADITVKAGELTELTMYQRGAEITLKLVSELGGEALANTSWTVLTPGGDPVVNTIASAFPSLILAAGDYIAFARHEGKNYSSSFTIESGVHRDVEVILED